MIEEIKSGKQILDEFFLEIKEIPDLDYKVINSIIELYNTDKLSDKNISNALLELREKTLNE